MLPFDALVVVDMQPNFYTRGYGSLERNRRLVYNINKDIKRFKKEGKPIFILEYSELGDSDSKLDTKDCIILKKQSDGGGGRINDYIYNSNLSYITRILICGINACACVRHTAWQLHEDYGFIVSIGKVGCNCHAPDKKSQLFCRLRANTFDYLGDRLSFSKRKAKLRIRQRLAAHSFQPL